MSNVELVAYQTMVCVQIAQLFLRVPRPQVEYCVFRLDHSLKLELDAPLNGIAMELRFLIIRHIYISIILEQI